MFVVSRFTRANVFPGIRCAILQRRQSVRVGEYGGVAGSLIQMRVPATPSFVAARPGAR